MLQSSSFFCIKRQAHAVSCCLVLLLFLIQVLQANALVVPNELPSILSLVYSNIPPIKKGTDSRLGFGFRLGEHADFQVLLELGPQKETRPIGNQDDSDGSSFNKRQVNKRQQFRVQQETTSTDSSSDSWLEKWSKDVNPSKKKVKLRNKQNSDKLIERPTMPKLPDQTLRQLQKLYQMATSSTTEETPTLTANLSVTGDLVTATHLQQRLKASKAGVNVDDLQDLRQQTTEAKKAEITKELMDVNLD